MAGALTTVRDVLVLGRLHFLFGGLLLFSFGALMAVAHGLALDPPRFMFAYAIVFCAQLSVSYSNDYFDSGMDGHSEPTPFSGGSGILVRRPELRPLSRGIAIALMAASMALTVAFMVAYDYQPFLLLLALAGNAMGWYYTAPPLKLAYRGAGEAAMMLTVGVLVPGFGYYGMGGGLDLPLLILIPAMMAYGLVFIINVQVPDMEGDMLGGKDTIVTRRGRPFAFRFTVVLNALAFTYLMAMGLLAGSVLDPDLRVVAGLSAIPLLISLGGLVRAPRQSGEATPLSTASVWALFLFIGLADVYLLTTSP